MNENVKLVPLINDKQEIVLYDMYIDGQWHGSRTTKWQADQYIYYALNYDQIMQKRQQDRQEFEEIIAAHNKKIKEEKQKLKQQKQEQLVAQASSGDETTKQIISIIEQLISEHSDKFELLKKKPDAINWFVGQVMKQGKGKFKPAIVTTILKTQFVDKSC